MADSSEPRASVERTLRECVRDAIERYLIEVDGEKVGDLHRMVIGEVEAPLLEAVMARTGHNQVKAATMLGINRGTLRKKLDIYGIGRSSSQRET